MTVTFLQSILILIKPILIDIFGNLGEEYQAISVFIIAFLLKTESEAKQ